MQLEPQEQFTIARQLPDPSDSATYYVRVSIRDAKTDDLIDRFGLVDKGDRRFSQTWQVVADTSGLGKYIIILSEVFTDSGYTTKSGLYADELTTYKVQQSSRSLGGGSVNNSNIDYKKLKKIFEDVIDGIPKAETQTITFDEVLRAIANLSDAVTSIEMPEFPEITATDLQPLISEINTSKIAILSEIQGIKIPDAPDMKPVLEAVSGLQFEKLANAIAQSVIEFSTIITGMREFSQEVPELQDKMEELLDDFKDILYNLTVSGVNEAHRPKESNKPDARVGRVASRLLKQR